MKTTMKIAVIAAMGMNTVAQAQDLISGGSNSWKLHTPDDGRTMMYLAPIKEDRTGFKWDKAVYFYNDGKVRFNNNISVQGKLESKGVDSNGDIIAGDFTSRGSNSWKLHTPDDGRTMMYLAPIKEDRTGFKWDKAVYFYNDGKVGFNNNISVQGKLESKGVDSNGDIIAGDFTSRGSNSWKLHTPDDGRTMMYLAPIKEDRTGFKWDKAVYFYNDGKVRFNNNISVQGKIESTEIKVTKSPTADFVFGEDYNLPTLKSIEKHIKVKKHLPEIASAKEMEKNGVNVGDFQIQLLQKIEELTLYTIAQEKEIKKEKAENKKQQKEIEELKKQNIRIKDLEILVQKLLKDKN
jgi:hypothetical protein